jgi:zinc protease
MIIRPLASLALALLMNAPLSAQAVRLPDNVEHVETHGGIAQYRLKSNGMPILLVPDRAAPVITFMVVYHVGSRNEAPGNTGSAHLLEHMIFNKSTENFGRARGHKTFQEVLYEAGADFSSTNMTTWYDRMNGYSTLPSDKLELAMKIEADRLGRGLILDEERQSEMSVVRNEFEIGENNPSQALFKALQAITITAHPYRWSTIGYRSDIEGVTTEKLREHYRNFFHPDNSHAILVGDFDPSSALAMFDREFGAFPRSEKPIPQVITVEPPQQGERRVVVRRPGALKLVQMAYMRPGALDPDFIPAEVLATILGTGISSRLHRAVVETRLATAVSSWNPAFRDPYPMLFFATVSDESTHAAVEEAIKATLYEIAAGGVTAEELRRAQEQIEVAVVRSRDGTWPFASALGEAVASADWKWFIDYVDRVRRVTTEDIQRIAAKYLVAERANVGWFEPVAADATAPASSTASVTTSENTPRQSAPAASASTKAPARPAPERRAAASFAQRTTRKVLPNGLIVDVVENRSVPTVAIRGSVGGGDAAAPAAQPAIPSLTAAMLKRGTKSRSKEQIADLLESRGAEMQFRSSRFETEISATGLSRDVNLILELLADQLRNPAFPADEIEKAKSEARNAVASLSENTGQRAIDRLTQIAYAERHPYRAATTPQMLASIDAAATGELRAYHVDRFVGSGTILAIVGDVDAKKTIALVERLFGGMPKGKPPVLTPVETNLEAAAAREAVRMPGKANMNIVLGHASGLRRNDPEWETALVANAVLGQNALSSRIGRRVRDTEGLSYSVASRFALSDQLDGLWYVNVNVAPTNLAKALASTREEIARYVTEGATAEEIAVAKSFFAGNFKVGLGSNGGIASALVTAERLGYGPRYLDDYPKRFERVTLDDVNRVVRQRLHPARMHLVVAGDLEELPE